MSEFSKPVLAVDSALAGCIAAVLDPVSGKSRARAIRTDRDQAAKLVPMVQDLMKEAGVEFSALSLIVTTTGPGSFTGLRIGLSTARAWGLALDIPVQGVKTFEAMARSCAQDGDTDEYAVILETKRGDFYFRIGEEEPLSADARTVAGAIAGRSVILCGDATERFIAETGRNGISDVRARDLLDPAMLARVGLEHFLKNGGKADKPEPFYMRGADVSMSNKAQRIIGDLPI